MKKLKAGCGVECLLSRYLGVGGRRSECLKVVPCMSLPGQHESLLDCLFAFSSFIF